MNVDLLELLGRDSGKADDAAPVLGDPDLVSRHKIPDERAIFGVGLKTSAIAPASVGSARLISTAA